MKSIEKQQVTPMQAAKWLKENGRNRSLRRSRVEQFAEAIRRGEWEFNGESIKFNGNGSLIDGQHRLAAIVEADQGIPLLIVRGLEGSAQETIDTGVRRTPADMLALRGVSHPTVVSSIARTITADGKLHRGGFKHPTPQQILQVADSDPLIHDAAQFAVSYRESHPEIRLTSTVIGELVYWFARAQGFEAAKRFFEELATSTEGVSLLLRRTLIDPKRSSNNRLMVQAWCIKAFNAWIEGRVLERLIWKRVGTHREDFPSIVGS